MHTLYCTMSATTPMTLRIDTELKAAAEQAASAAGVTLTDFVVTALKQAANPRCGTCGRTNPTSTTAPAFTDAFAEFYQARCENLGEPFTVFTLEGAHMKVYWCRLKASYALAPGAGAIVVDLLLNWTQFGQFRVAGDATLPAAIPRGVIQGWAADPHSSLYITQRTLGYVDGNEPARHAYMAMLAQQAPR